jgi:hypothetical protein
MEEFNNHEDYTNFYNEYIENDLYINNNNINSKYNIILCELYNPYLHGEANTNVIYHYLVIEKFKKLDIDYLNLYSNFYYIYYYNNLNNRKHNIYRNYSNIISNTYYIKPEIAECIYLSTGECIAILKTFWIKLIQRTWKNIYSKKKNIIDLRKNPNNIKYKEIYGNWSNICKTLPSIKGMLNYLKK